jgi:dihydrofolate reductase
MISIIVAMARNRVIGIENRLPWHLPGDLQWFRRNTLGKTVVMGRRTYESIGKPLPDRRNVVITRDAAFKASGCILAHSLDEALANAGTEEIMVMGGEEIYRQCLPRTQRLYLTLVDAEITGDAWFPEIDWSDWAEVERQSFPADDRNPYGYSFLILDRKPLAR